jgi:hypothetical protein
MPFKKDGRSWLSVCLCFDKDYMLALEEMGRTMGADPSSWKTEVPLVYSFD